VLRYQINSFGSLPISVATAKDYLKVETAADDNMITKLVAGITTFAERHTGRELRINEWFAYDDEFPLCWEIRRTPIADINSIQHIVSGGAVTVSTDIYQLDKTGLYPVLKLKDGQSWPTDTDVNKVDSILINFTTQVDQRIDEIIIYMLRHMADIYENRGDDANMDNIKMGGSFYSNVRIPLH
jgi:uncharacterized phiE125 gp8 family phage protein